MTFSCVIFSCQDIIQSLQNWYVLTKILFLRNCDLFIGNILENRCWVVFVVASFIIYAIDYCLRRLLFNKRIMLYCFEENHKGLTDLCLCCPSPS